MVVRGVGVGDCWHDHIADAPYIDTATWDVTAGVATAVIGRKERSYTVRVESSRVTQTAYFRRGLLEYGIYPRCVRRIQ